MWSPGIVERRSARVDPEVRPSIWSAITLPTNAVSVACLRRFGLVMSISLSPLVEDVTEPFVDTSASFWRDDPAI
jgi:hypothetical protein